MDRPGPVRAVAAGTELVTGVHSLAVATEDAVVILRLKEHDKPERTKEVAVQGVTRLRFGVTGRVVTAGLSDGSVRVLDVV